MEVTSPSSTEPDDSAPFPRSDHAPSAVRPRHDPVAPPGRTSMSDTESSPETNAPGGRSGKSGDPAKVTDWSLTPSSPQLTPSSSLVSEPATPPWSQFEASSTTGSGRSSSGMSSPCPTHPTTPTATPQTPLSTPPTSSGGGSPRPAALNGHGVGVASGMGGGGVGLSFASLNCEEAQAVSVVWVESPNRFVVSSVVSSVISSVPDRNPDSSVHLYYVV